MFHIFHGHIQQQYGTTYIRNDLLGLAIVYSGEQEEAELYLFPYMDQNAHTIKYFAFDTPAQKAHFEKLIKVQGIGPKSGYYLAMLPQEDLTQAVQTMDVKYFQQIPGIGPKTAKRLILELRQTVTAEDLGKLDIDERLYKDIVDSLKALGYERTKIKNLLPECPVVLEKDKLPEIMKWLIDNL